MLANALSLSTTQSADLDDELFMNDPIHSSFKSPIKTYVHVYRGGFCGRGNTTASYSELNRYVSYKYRFLPSPYSHDIIGYKAGYFDH